MNSTEDKASMEALVRNKVREYGAAMGGINKRQEDQAVARILARLESGQMSRMARSAAGVILVDGGSR